MTDAFQGGWRAGKVAFFTGGGSRITLTVAERFAALGARVARAALFPSQEVVAHMTGAVLAREGRQALAESRALAADAGGRA